MTSVPKARVEHIIETADKLSTAEYVSQTVRELREVASAQHLDTLAYLLGVALADAEKVIESGIKDTSEGNIKPHGK